VNLAGVNTHKLPSLEIEVTNIRNKNPNHKSVKQIIGVQKKITPILVMTA